VVINKLEKLLEQSVSSKAKASEYQDRILDVTSEINKLKKQVALAKPSGQTFGLSASV
jgi:hypothetical protein